MQVLSGLSGSTTTLPGINYLFVALTTCANDSLRGTDDPPDQITDYYGHAILAKGGIQNWGMFFLLSLFRCPINVSEQIICLLAILCSWMDG